MTCQGDAFPYQLSEWATDTERAVVRRQVPMEASPRGIPMGWAGEDRRHKHRQRKTFSGGYAPTSTTSCRCLEQSPQTALDVLVPETTLPLLELPQELVRTTADGAAGMRRAVREFRPDVVLSPPPVRSLYLTCPSLPWCGTWSPSSDCRRGTRRQRQSGS